MPQQICADRRKNRSSQVRIMEEKMDFNVSKNKGFNYTVKGRKKGDKSPQIIPDFPEETTFFMESSWEPPVEIWVDDPDAPGNIAWVFKFTPTGPQSVNVTIGGDD